VWKEWELMQCIESSLASMAAARYSLLRSVMTTFLFLKVRSQRMAAVLELLRGYLILSFLASSIYQRSPGQLALGRYHELERDGRDEDGDSDLDGVWRRQRAMMEMQSSFGSGLLIRHYLRYWHRGRGPSWWRSCCYLSSPRQFAEQLMVWLLVGDGPAADSVVLSAHRLEPARGLLVCNVVQFLFVEQQFVALHRILSLLDATSPLFGYLMARCHIEMARRRHRSLSVMAATSPTADEDAATLLDSCCRCLVAMRRPFEDENERKLLGLILTTERRRCEVVDVYHLAPSEAIVFCAEFEATKRAEDEKRRRSDDGRRRVSLFGGGAESRCLSERPEYDWAIPAAFYFHVVELYKRSEAVGGDTDDGAGGAVGGQGGDGGDGGGGVSRPKMMIFFAKKGIEFIDGRRERAMSRLKAEDGDGGDVKVEEEAVRRVAVYGNVSEKEAERLCGAKALGGDLECILLSIYKWRLVQEIVSCSLRMGRYGAAYRHLMAMAAEDLESASLRSAIKEFVAVCCRNKAMAPILDNEWTAGSEGAVHGDDGWRRQLLSFSRTNNIDLKARSLRNLVESMLYRLALQFDVADSFCFDLLFTFSMKHCAYDLAAKYMVEYALRIEQCLAQKTAATQRLQHHCLCHVLSAMDLMDGREATKYLAIDFAISCDLEPLRCAPNASFITFRQLRSWYILIESKLALFALDPPPIWKSKPLGVGDGDHAMTEHDIATLNVLDTANQLHAHGLYDESLALRSEFDVDCSPLFDVMVNRLLFGPDDLQNGRKLEWHDLDRLLTEYDGAGTQYKYTLGVIQSILTLTAGSGASSHLDLDQPSDSKATPFEIPSFVMHRIQSVTERKDIDLLLLPIVEMLCRSGHILDGVRMLCFALDRAQSLDADAEHQQRPRPQHRYHYQEHSVWRTANRVYAQCAALHLEAEQNSLMKAMAQWVQGAR